IAAPKNSAVRLEARPLIAFRDYHSTTHENQSLDGRIQQEPGSVSVQPYAGLPRLYLAHNAQNVQPGGDWYRQFYYAIEAERGWDCVEDLFNPVMLTFDLSARTAPVLSSPQAVDC